MAGARDFDHKRIEGNWKDKWVQDNVCAAVDDSTKPKKYILAEFPYPSGKGLHMGHFMRYTVPEIYARKLRMNGFNVLFPFGWDAFGLPAENYAVQTGVHPAETTKTAIENFRRSLQDAGFGVDWQREVDTTDPGYYKWTQWIFLRLWETGLAEMRNEPVWWCEELKTVLANEEVLEDEQGCKISERGEHPVEKRELRQWVLKITAYADRLLAGLDTIDFPDYIKTAQTNWIGRSEGALISFPLESSGGQQVLEVFTTRPDTLFGVTFMVVAPEHPILAELKDSLQNYAAVRKYCDWASNRSEMDRQTAKEKTGVCLSGVSARHPLAPDGPPLPVYVSDYVLMGYGTGAIMAVPAHDERDFEFAQTFKIPVVQTIYTFPPLADALEETAKLPFVTKDGFVRISSAIAPIFPPERLSRLAVEPLSCEEMIQAVVAALAARGLGRSKVTYRLRDWLFSRQRYWGEPIPLVHKVDGTVEALARTDNPAEVADNLPLELPAVPDYQPSSDGASPLAKNKDWVACRAKDGSPAQRETNTMPNWAGSCWYYIRYLDPNNDRELCARAKMQYWLPVDRYFGGGEHTTRHLLYARFWHQFLYDQGIVPCAEPFAWRVNGGILLGEDGFKQSKSRGNVIDLSEKLKECGADALRLYICFLGPYDATMSWNEGGLRACRRLVETVYDLRLKVKSEVTDLSLLKLYHRMVQRVSSMVDNLKMNTAVSEFMIFTNEAKKAAAIDRGLWEGFVRLIAPFMVFTAEELWQELNGYSEWRKENSVHLAPWPTFDAELAKEEVITVGVQVNGKLRGTIEVVAGDTEAAVREKVAACEGVQKWIAGRTLQKFIYKPGRIVSIVC